MTTIVQLAKQMDEAFVVETRDDGTNFWKLRDGSPQWMNDVVYEAHGGGFSLPDDTIYEIVRDVVSAFSELDDDADEETLRERLYEIEPEYRNYQLAVWVAQWSEYIDEVVGNFGKQEIESSTDFWKLIQLAQGMQIEEIGNRVVASLSELVTDDEEGEE